MSGKRLPLALQVYGDPGLLFRNGQRIPVLRREPVRAAG